MKNGWPVSRICGYAGWKTYLAAATLLWLIASLAFSAPSVVIDTIEPPPTGASIGYKPEVFRNLVNARLLSIKAFALRDDDERFVANDRRVHIQLPQNPVDFEVPGTSLSRSNISRLLQEWLGLEPTHIVGSVILDARNWSNSDPSRFLLTLYIRKGRAERVVETPITEKDPTALPHRIAEAILESVDPYLLATSLYPASESPHREKFQSILATIINDRDSKDRISALFLRAAWYKYIQRDYRRALSDYNTLIDLSPDSAEAAAGQAHTYASIGSEFFEKENDEDAFKRYDQAEAVYSEFLERYSSHPKTPFLKSEWASTVNSKANGLRNRIDALMRKGSAPESITRAEEIFEKAQAEYARALAISSAQADAIHVDWGDLLAESADYFEDRALLHQAIDHFERALALNPKSESAHHRWGIALILGTPDQRKAGIEHLTQAIALNPRVYALILGQTILNHATEAASTGRPDLAIASCDRLIEALSNVASPRWDAYVQWARALYLKANLTKTGTSDTEQSEMYRDAIELLESAVKLNPSTPFPYPFLGDVYLAIGEHQQALDTLDRYLTKFPRSVHALLGKARSLEGLNRFEEAAATYESITKIEPRNVEAYEGWNGVLAKNGKIKEAQKVKERMHALRKTQPAIHADPQQ